MKSLCKHCHLGRPYNGVSGLCYYCKKTPAIRALYPKRPVFEGFGQGNHKRTPPAVPTTAPPGSPEKVEVLAARAAADVGLWHPEDAQHHRQPCACVLCSWESPWADRNGGEKS